MSLSCFNVHKYIFEFILSSGIDFFYIELFHRSSKYSLITFLKDKQSNLSICRGIMDFIENEKYVSRKYLRVKLP